MASLLFPDNSSDSNLDQPQAPLATPTEVDQIWDLLKYCPPLSRVQVDDMIVRSTADRELTFRRFTLTKEGSPLMVNVEVNPRRGVKVWVNHVNHGSRFLYDSSNPSHPSALTSPQAQALIGIVQKFNQEVSRFG